MDDLIYFSTRHNGQVELVCTAVIFLFSYAVCCNFLLLHAHYSKCYSCYMNMYVWFSFNVVLWYSGTARCTVRSCPHSSRNIMARTCQGSIKSHVTCTWPSVARAIATVIMVLTAVVLLMHETVYYHNILCTCTITIAVTMTHQYWTLYTCTWVARHNHSHLSHWRHL